MRVLSLVTIASIVLVLTAATGLHITYTYAGNTNTNHNAQGNGLTVSHIETGTDKITRDITRPQINPDTNRLNTMQTNASVEHAKKPRSANQKQPDGAAKKLPVRDITESPTKRLQQRRQTIDVTPAYRTHPKPCYKDC